MIQLRPYQTIDFTKVNRYFPNKLGFVTIKENGIYIVMRYEL